MKFEIASALCAISLLSACATTQSVASKVEDMELRPNSTYCVMESEGGATLLTNRLALDAFYLTRSLPTCEVLYQSYYDFQAPTARERVSDLSRRIDAIETDLRQKPE